MTEFLKRFALVCVLLLLGACAKQQLIAQQFAPLPGTALYYSYGVSQSKENFVNIARAQSHVGLYTKQRTWQEIRPTRAPANINMLQSYYPMSVRWELKDGRQFFLENIDVAAIMREYFKAHRLELPYQREGRAVAEGDSDPSLVHEVRDDSVIIKWLIRTNHTPLALRRTSPPQLTYEEYPVTELKGKPTKGIDFENWVEILK